MSESGIYYGPVEGKPHTWSKRELMEELSEICGFSMNLERENHGCVTVQQLDSMLEFAGLEAEGHTKKEKLDCLAEEAGFSYHGSYGCLEKDELWDIYQYIKEVQQIDE